MPTFLTTIAKPSAHSHISHRESDESLLGPQEAEPTKTWKGKDEAAREAEIAAKALAEQRAKEEEAKKPQLGVYRPGQGLSLFFRWVRSTTAVHRGNAADQR